MVCGFAFTPLPALAQIQPAAKAPAADTLASAWKDMLSGDEAKATCAALEFGKQPEVAVAFLKANLRPLKAEPKIIAKLIEELGNKDFTTRESAQAELEYFSKFIKGDLEAALKSSGEEEAKNRIAKLLGRIAEEEKEAKLNEEKPAPELGNGRGGASVSVRTVNGVTTVFINGKPIDTTPKVVAKLPPLSTWTRAARAIGILESIGTPDAVKQLEAISLGEDTAAPTKLAQDAIARLKRKK